MVHHMGSPHEDTCMTHVVLLGDSIFDNSAYVAGGPDVVRQLQARLPAGSRASLAARDGARITDVASQVDRIAPDATHLVVSVGGNDVLEQLGVLQDRTNSIAAALDRLATIRDGFEADYRSMLQRVLARGLPLRSVRSTTLDFRSRPCSALPSRS